MHASRLALALAFAMVCSCAHAQVTIQVSPKAVKPAPPPYESISLAVTGPAHSFSDESVRGKVQRILVVQLGLAYDRPKLRFETLTYGDEGCCTRLVAAWELDLNDLAERGLKLPDAATSELRFVRWQSPRTAEFRYGDLSCEFQGIGLARVTASCRQ